MNLLPTFIIIHIHPSIFTEKQKYQIDMLKQKFIERSNLTLCWCLFTHSTTTILKYRKVLFPKNVPPIVAYRYTTCKYNINIDENCNFECELK